MTAFRAANCGAPPDSCGLRVAIGDILRAGRSSPTIRISFDFLVDPLQSTARLLQSSIVGARHASVAARVREHLARLDTLALSAQTSEQLESDPLTSRAWKLTLFLSQPFYVVEPYTPVPGLWVRREETIDGCSAILDGKADHLPARPFYFSGTFDDVCRNAGQ